MLAGLWQSTGGRRGVGLAVGLAISALLAACASAVQTDVSQQDTDCSSGQDSGGSRAVDFKVPPFQPYTDAERDCWIGWADARQLAAHGAQWVDARGIGLVQRLRLTGALAVPSEDVADKAALRGLDLLILGDDVDLRSLSRQCLAWRQSGHFRGVHIVLGGVRTWRLTGQPTQAVDRRAAVTPEPPDTVTPAEYWKGLPDGLWRVVAVGLDANQQRALDYPVALTIPTADTDAFGTLRQALARTGKDDSADAVAQSWLVVAPDASAQARLQALWNRQQIAAAPTANGGQQTDPAPPAPTLLWLGGGLRAYRDYLTAQRQLAAHAGHALPRLCGFS
jgi:rhodanese-related sulfurtransferase